MPVVPVTRVSDRRRDRHRDRDSLPDSESDSESDKSHWHTHKSKVRHNFKLKINVSESTGKFEACGA